MRSSRTRVTAGPKSPDRPTRSFRSLPPLYASYFFAVFFRCSDCARRRSSCSLSSGVNSAPKSSASNTWRISISKCKKRVRNGTDLFFNAVGDSRRFSRRCQYLLSGCQRVRKPMRRGGGGGGALGSGVGSKRTLQLASLFFFRVARRLGTAFLFGDY